MKCMNKFLYFIRDVYNVDEWSREFCRQEWRIYSELILNVQCRRDNPLG